MKNRFQWVGSETKPVTTDLHITIKQIIQISHTYKNNLSHNSVMFWAYLHFDRGEHLRMAFPYYMYFAALHGIHNYVYSTCNLLLLIFFNKSNDNYQKYIGMQPHLSTLS